MKSNIDKKFSAHYDAVEAELKSSTVGEGGPKSAQIHPKIQPKSPKNPSINRAKITPKSSQIHPKILHQIQRNSPQNSAEIAQKSFNK
ncbi:hypothetical protein HGM15179_022036 [Zosterops borbonicus]|uniref:Uncharacterized protein n=1 Tax=Zosterops borbonicus TaxID=364589 RepID=A0A8K1D760_9PASS|nr:hypothetical protein HGM15179_022036 [Zosterops borbonicus]